MGGVTKAAHILMRIYFFHPPPVWRCCALLISLWLNTLVTDSLIRLGLACSLGILGGTRCIFNCQAGRLSGGEGKSIHTSEMFLEFTGFELLLRPVVESECACVCLPVCLLE